MDEHARQVLDVRHPAASVLGNEIERHDHEQRNQEPLHGEGSYGRKAAGNGRDGGNGIHTEERSNGGVLAAARFARDMDREDPDTSAQRSHVTGRL